MGIFSRLAQLIKSNLNDLISKSEDPEKMLNQVVLEMSNQLIEAKKQVAASIADEKRLAKQLEQETANATEWERRAMMALRAGNEELAKEALARKKEHDELADDATRTSGPSRRPQSSSSRRRSACSTTRSRRRSARRTSSSHGRSAPRRRRSIQETMSGLRDQSAFETFDRMAGKIDQMEAEAEAAGEIQEEYTGDTLASKFKHLEKTAGADEEIVALKRKMGMLPPEPPPEAPVTPARVEAPVKGAPAPVATRGRAGRAGCGPGGARGGAPGRATQDEPLGDLRPRDAMPRPLAPGLAGTAGRPVHAERVDTLLARLGTDPASGLASAEAGRRLAQHGRTSSWRRRGRAHSASSSRSSPTPSSSRCSRRRSSPSSTARAGRRSRSWSALATRRRSCSSSPSTPSSGFYQERRAEAALDALQKMQTPRARAAPRRRGLRSSRPRRSSSGTSSSSRRATRFRPMRACSRPRTCGRGERR